MNTLFDDFGAEELGIALGLGEEIGIEERENFEARRANELEPISIEEYKCSMQQHQRKDLEPPKPGSFEAWVEGVINGTINPHKIDDYPVFEDPM